MSRWPVARLADAAKVLSGGTPSKAKRSFWQGAIPWVSPKDMNGSVIGDAADHISEDAIANSATRLVPAGTILIVVRSGILARTVPIALTARQVAFNQDIKALLVDRGRVLPEFVVWWLRSKEPVLLAQGVKRGATVHSLASDFLESLPLPLPPLEEQRRIVDILNHAASIRRLRDQAKAKAKELIPALFLDMFGDLRLNLRGLPTRALREIADIGSGITKGRKLDAEITVEAPYLRVANVQDGFLDLSEMKKIPVRPTELSKYGLRVGDLLMTEGGDPDKLGRAALWQGEIPNCVHQNHVFRVRPHRDVVDSIFLRALAGSSYGKDYFLRVAKRTTGIASINRTQLGNFPVLLPPLSLQTTFAERVADIQATIGQMDRAAAAAEQLQAALMARLFAGG